MTKKKKRKEKRQKSGDWKPEEAKQQQQQQKKAINDQKRNAQRCRLIAAGPRKKKKKQQQLLCSGVEARSYFTSQRRSLVPIFYRKRERRSRTLVDAAVRRALSLLLSLCSCANDKKPICRLVNKRLRFVDFKKKKKRKSQTPSCSLVVAGIVIKLKAVFCFELRVPARC